ncbi:alpha/beta fold hydrolase [bacterium]|nr:alpha/beta fold hydrolase [bacterium]
MAPELTLVSLALAGLALTWRVRARGAEIRRRYPPLGRMVTVAGRRVHALTLGEGPDLVLIHGASGQLRDLVPLMQQLAPRFRVTAFDRPGLGHSESLGAAGIAPADQARHLARAAEAMGLTSPIVLGQSYGGAVALAWALEVTGPLAASALVLVSAAAMPWPGKLDWSYRLTETWVGRALILPIATALVTDARVEAMMPSLFAPSPPPPDYVSTTGATLALPLAHLQANARQVNGLYAHVSAMQHRYPALEIPVELVHGLADTIVPAAIHAQPLSQLIPEAQLTLLPEVGHMPHHTHPQAVIDAITRAAARAGWT